MFDLIIHVILILAAGILSVLGLISVVVFMFCFRLSSAISREEEKNDKKTRM